jgi:hypothetical protein
MPPHGGQRPAGRCSAAHRREIPDKKAPGQAEIGAPVGSRTNSPFRGTQVVRGRAEALVVRVVRVTVFGRTVKRLEHRGPPTSFEKGISAFGSLLLRVMVVVVAVIFLINIALSRPFVDSQLFSLALPLQTTRSTSGPCSRFSACTSANRRRRKGTSQRPRAGRAPRPRTRPLRNGDGHRDPPGEHWSRASFGTALANGLTLR